MLTAVGAGGGAPAAGGAAPAAAGGAAAADEEKPEEKKEEAKEECVLALRSCENVRANCVFLAGPTTTWASVSSTKRLAESNLFNLQVSPIAFIRRLGHLPTLRLARLRS